MTDAGSCGGAIALGFLGRMNQRAGPGRACRENTCDQDAEGRRGSWRNNTGHNKTTLDRRQVDALDHNDAPTSSLHSLANPFIERIPDFAALRSTLVAG